MRARRGAVTLMDRARAPERDTDLGNRLTGQPGPGRLQPGGARRGFWSRVDARAGQFGVTDPPPLCGIRGARGRVMAWPAAGYGLAAGGLRGEEDEQA